MAVTSETQSLQIFPLVSSFVEREYININWASDERNEFFLYYGVEYIEIYGLLRSISIYQLDIDINTQYYKVQWP